MVFLSLVVVWTLAFSNFARNAGNRVYDSLQTWKSFQPSKEIVIVAIDDKALDSLGGWPLSRKHYADLLALLDKPGCKPLAVGFDLLFLDPTPQDAELAERMALHRVVLPLEFRWDTRSSEAVEFKTAVLPIRTAATFGHINIAFDADGVVRRVNLVDRQWPHFSVQLQEQASKKTAAATTIQLEPARQDTVRRISLPALANGYKTVSLADALLDGCSDGLFKDKLVLIGVTAPSLGDRFPTAMSVQDGSSMSGVEILAGVLDGVRSDRLIRDASKQSLIAGSIAVLLAFVACFLFVPLGHLILSAPIIQAMWIVICAYFLHGHHVWLNPVPACLAITASALAWAMVRHESIVVFVRSKTRDLQLSALAVRTPVTKPAFTDSIIRPFNEMNSAVSSVRHALEFLSLLVNEIPESVAVYNESDELLLTNRHIQSLFDENTIAPRAALEALLTKLHIDYAALNSIGTPDRSTDASMQVFGVQTKLGERDFSLKCSVIRGPEGVFLRLLFLADLTELRKHQIQRDRTLRFLSHDMRTPIAAIISLIRMNASKSAGDVAVNRGPQMLQQARTLLQMVDDFTYTVSAEVGNFKFKDELLETLLNDALEQVMPLAHAKGQTVEDVNPPETVFVSVDTRLFVRALVNLLANAIKFAPADSSIVLKTQVTDTPEDNSANSSQVIITISNTVQTQPNKLDKSNSMEGFGIGLNFVENVLRKHFGSIQRHIPSSGTATVSLRLPCTIQK